MSVLMNRRCSLDPGSAALAAHEYAGLVVYDAESAGRLRAGTLAEALTNIISDTALIKRVRKIRVCRSYLIAEIVWDDPEGFRSFFGVPGNQSSLRLPDDHTFEEGIAALIGIWGNEDAMRATTKILDSLGAKPVFTASIQDNEVEAFIYVSDATFGYALPTIVELSTHDTGSAELFRRMLAAWNSVRVRYESGIKSVRTVQNTLLRSLGEVVADLREPGSGSQQDRKSSALLDVENSDG